MYLLDLQNRQTEMKTLIGKEDWKQGIGNEQSEVKNSAKRELFIFFVLLVNQDKPVQCNTPTTRNFNVPPRASHGHYPGPPTGTTPGHPRALVCRLCPGGREFEPAVSSLSNRISVFYILIWRCLRKKSHLC